MKKTFEIMVAVELSDDDLDDGMTLEMFNHDHTHLEELAGAKAARMLQAQVWNDDEIHIEEIEP